MAAITAVSSSPPTKISPRFTLELEFVLCLSNPHYLPYLATNYPNLFTPSASDDSDAAKFAAYLKYLYAYWSKPEYAKFLTHPGAVLNTLKLLQQEQFRRDIIRPDLVDALLRGGVRLDNAAAEGEAPADSGGNDSSTRIDGERMDEGAG